MAQAEAAAPATAEAPSPSSDGRKRRDGVRREGFGEMMVVIVPRHCSHRV